MLRNAIVPGVVAYNGQQHQQAFLNVLQTMLRHAIVPGAAAYKGQQHLQA